MLANLGFKSALTVTMVVIITLTVILNVESVYAQTLVVTPNQVTQGMSVQVTGSEFDPAENGQVVLYASNKGTCGEFPVMTIDASTDDNGKLGPVTIQTSGLSVGTYCVQVNSFLDFPATVYLTVNGATATATPAAREMPGFPIEAIFIGLLLGLVAVATSRRRKHVHDRET